MNGGEKISRYNTQLTVANFTGKRKKIQSGYFIATPRKLDVPTAVYTAGSQQREETWNIRKNKLMLLMAHSATKLKEFHDRK